MLQIFKSDYIKLVPVLALAFYLAFIPNIDYPYPVHIDEWRHIAHANTLYSSGDLDFIDPFTGAPATDEVSTLEFGFHLLFGSFQRISGLTWFDIVRYFPGIVFIAAVLSVYIMARRTGFGWEAAFFTCLIPTGIGILGPGFFVPVALGLIFVPLSLFLVYNFRNIWSYLTIFVFFAFLMVSHPPSAVCLIIILVPCALLYFRTDFRHGLKLILVWLIPFVAALPLTYDLVVETAGSLFIEQSLPVDHELPLLIKTYGYYAVGLALLGTFWLAIKGGVNNYSLVLALLLLSGIMTVFYTLHYGSDMVYLRGILFMILILSIVAGVGLKLVKNLELSARLNVPVWVRKIGYPLCLAFVVIILVTGIPDRLNTSYYHMIDREDYEAFTWIKDNVDDAYHKALLDPWKATAFTAITGKYIYSRIHVTTTARHIEIEEFLEEGCPDTAFLTKNGISIVYNRLPCSNPDLVEVREYVYLLKDSESR